MVIKRLFLICIGIACLHIANAEKVLNIQHWKTEKGVPVYFVEAPDLPMLDVIVGFDAGSSRDGKLNGIARLTNSLLDQGTNKLSADQIATNFDEVGAQYSSTAFRDIALVELRALTKPSYLIPALATFQAVLSHPSFNQHAFDRERDSQLASIAYKKQNPNSLASDALFSALYKDHPYGHPITGRASTLRKIQVYDVEQFYKKYYNTSNMLIVMVGAIDKSHAKRIADQLSGNLNQGKKPQALPHASNHQQTNQHIKLPVAQTTLLLGQVAIDRLDPDYFALMVANYSLGSGAFVSRLYQQVREKRGLSYNIYSHFIPMRARGPFIVSFATRQAQANQALAVAQDVVRKFVQNGPTPGEIEAAKKNIIGGFTLNLDSNNAIANAVLSYAFFHLPENYFDTYQQRINAVSAVQIKQALKKLNPEQMSIISVGNLKLVKRDHAQA